MDILYKSTRGKGETVSASRAILKGLADDGGLYVPTEIPALDIPFEQLAGMDYKGVAYEVMSRFLCDFSADELKDCIESAYDKKFDTDEIAPVVKKDGVYFLELFHGATIAFKDMALSILPYLMTVSAKKNNIKNDIVILTATSGDTGKAALAGFADVPHTKIIVFYPKGGVSRIQELQMTTQKGHNTFVCGVNGNFDDCQSAVKKMFSDPALKEMLAGGGYQFSSANSINIGRLVPQVAYYVWAYSRLIANGEIGAGEKINFVVPTGNFGNILAGYYAKLMGLPVNMLICASNENKVLYDFFESGVYDINRQFILTSSPSMDILISSNLERLIYKIVDSSGEKNSQLMSELSEKGVYKIPEEAKEKLSDFTGGFACEDENFSGIKALYEKEGYVIDTHTGVAYSVYKEYLRKTGDNTPGVIVSTASPYKFSKAVMGAIDEKYKDKDDLDLIYDLKEVSGRPVPNAMKDILQADICHDTVCAIDGLEAEVRGFLNL